MIKKKHGTKSCDGGFVGHNIDECESSKRRQRSPPAPPNNMDNTISLYVKGTMTHFTYLISYYLFTDYSMEWAPPYYPMMGIFLLSVFY